MQFLTKKTKGFTLIEVLVVVALISILMGILLGVLNVQGLREKTADSIRKTNVGKIADGIRSYYAFNGKYPVCDSCDFLRCTHPDIPGLLISHECAQCNPLTCTGNLLTPEELQAQQTEIRKYIKSWPNGNPTASDVYAYTSIDGTTWELHANDAVGGAAYTYNSITDSVVEGPLVPVPPTLAPGVPTPTPLPDYWVAVPGDNFSCETYCYTMVHKSCKNDCHFFESGTYTYGLSCKYEYAASASGYYQTYAEGTASNCNTTGWCSSIASLQFPIGVNPPQPPILARYCCCN